MTSGSLRSPEVTLNYLLENFILEENFDINFIDIIPTEKKNGDTPILSMDDQSPRYHINFIQSDIILQFDIYADSVQEVYLMYTGAVKVPLIVKQVGFSKWSVSLKFPSIAIGALCFGSYLYLYLPGAINVQKIVKLGRNFISKDRCRIGNTFLQEFDFIKFEIDDNTYTIYNDF